MLLLIQRTDIQGLLLWTEQVVVVEVVEGVDGNENADMELKVLLELLAAVLLLSDEGDIQDTHG